MNRENISSNILFHLHSIQILLMEKNFPSPLTNQRNKNDTISIFFTCMFNVFIEHTPMRYGMDMYTYMQRSSFLKISFDIQVHVHANLLVTMISRGIDLISPFLSCRLYHTPEITKGNMTTLGLNYGNQ